MIRIGRPTVCVVVAAGLLTGACTSSTQDRSSSSPTPSASFTHHHLPTPTSSQGWADGSPTATACSTATTATPARWDGDLGDGSRNDPGIHETIEPAVPASLVAWSNDGSKLLILRLTGHGSTRDASLYVLNADGSETLLVDSGCWYCLSGGSFSPDGSKVVYASMTADGASSGIYVVEAAGGTPKLLPEPLRGPYDPVFSLTGLRSPTSRAGAITTTPSR